MTPITTRRLASDAAGIEAAAALLRAGKLVAFPTETVYGLGASALDAEAVRGIFRAKGRPADDPVIVHLADASQLTSVAEPTPAAERLANAFWPGPLTLVLRKRPAVPAEATAGLDTVGVRVPSDPIALSILRAAGVPVAAPSANLFGRPSPTRAEHVLEDLDGRIDAVLDGGPTSVGVESTIVDLCHMEVGPRLLRPGGLQAERIEALLGMRLLEPPRPSAGPQAAPGLLPSHYAPRTPLTLILGGPAQARARLLREVEAALRSGQRVGVLALDNDRFPPEAIAEYVGAFEDPSASSARLFHALRALDQRRLDVLFARLLADPSVGLGTALADRLRRAAQRIIDAEA